MDNTFIAGDKAGAQLDPLMVYGEEGQHLSDPKLPFIKNDPYLTEINHFLDCINNGKKPESTLESGLAVQKMLNGIYDSAKQGREVNL